jgi:hypothetical protein
MLLTGKLPETPVLLHLVEEKVESDAREFGNGAGSSETL